MQIFEDVKLDFSDVMLMPKRSTLDSRSKVNLTRDFVFKHSPIKYSGMPLLVSNMDTTGTIAMAHALTRYNVGVALHKFYTKEQLIEYYSSEQFNPHTFYTMGITEDDYTKFKLINSSVGRPVEYVCIDVANGYSRKFVDFVTRVRTDYPELVIMAGNIVTPDMTYDLLDRGADIIKIGIGSGSVCTTRKLTGIGYPQMSAILECADAAHGSGGLICGDGGVITVGDIAKGFGGGADFMMCGGMFAGHTECEGELVDNGTKMRFYGMSSHEAMNKHYGGKADYRASEGKCVDIPCKGPVKETVEEILGGLRSTCTYIGARRIKDLSKCATFIKVNQTHNTIYGE